MAAERPDYLIANSNYTQERIKKYYRRESTVIYPPVDMSSAISHQTSGKNIDDRLLMTNYFLIVSRLSPYKKVDLAVEAFNKLELPLIVIGEGMQEKYLRKIAKNNIKILGWKSQEKLSDYYQNARAFIFPAFDDFGITAVEAMSYGLPIIAFKKGGAAETVEEGKSGIFFDSQTPEVLADAVRRFMAKENQFDQEVIKKRAEEFSRERFRTELNNLIEKVIGHH
jgi:glycosyltransferase involved in cell wall biosynthesis